MIYKENIRYNVYYRNNFFYKNEKLIFFKIKYLTHIKDKINKFVLNRTLNFWRNIKSGKTLKELQEFV